MQTHKKIIPTIWAAFIAALLVLCFLNSCKQDNNKVKIGYLNGPTSISLSQMPQDNYDYNKFTSPDTLVSEFATGKIDIALLPANVASNLYNKTNGQVTAIDINTLGVIEYISQNEDASNYIGKKFYSTGKGTVVEAINELFIKSYGLSTEQINIQYKSDAAEVISYITNDPSAIGILNEPQASIAIEKNPKFKIINSAQNIWKKQFGDDSDLLTAIAIVKKDYLNTNKSLVDKFLKDHKESIDKIKSDYDNAANIINNAEDNLKYSADSIKNCNLAYIDGIDMKKDLSKFLEKLFDINANLVGNKLPDDDFYYINE